MFYRIERNVANWTALEERATKLLGKMPKEKKSTFIQLVWMPVSLVTNLNKLHAAGEWMGLFTPVSWPED